MMPITSSVFGSLGRVSGPGQSVDHAVLCEPSLPVSFLFVLVVNMRSAPVLCPGKLKSQHLLLVNRITIAILQSRASDRSQVWVAQGFGLHVCVL